MTETSKTQDWSAWDEWVRAHINNAMDRYAGALGAECGEMEKRIRLEVRRELEVAVGELRAELTVLGAHGKGIVDLGSWKAKKHDAA
jgi:hypothetical protein